MLLAESNYSMVEELNSKKIKCIIEKSKKIEKSIGIHFNYVVYAEVRGR